MCTLTLAWRAFEDAPIVVAANRDEQLGRPSESPAVRDWDRPTLAPLDVQAGGTWIGANDAGVVAAVTNRWTETQLAGDRSRGLLVRDALGCDDAEEATRLVEQETAEREYAGFNLLIADETAAFLLEWDGYLRVRNLQPGVHVVVNVGANDEFAVPPARPQAGNSQVENARKLRAHLQPEPGENANGWLDRAASALGDHEFGVCIHGDGYGTRSSSLLVIGEDDVTYRFADGPPCETDYEEIEEAV